MSHKITSSTTVTTASSTGTASTYIGMTENDFKTRFDNQKLTLLGTKTTHMTTQSKHSLCIWELRDNDMAYDIKWQIIKRANAYKANPLSCNLCLSKKLCILTARSASLLNKRSELVNKCHHDNKFFATKPMPCSNRPWI